MMHTDEIQEVLAEGDNPRDSGRVSYIDRFPYDEEIEGAEYVQALVACSTWSSRRFDPTAM